jgi:hypothetical protein
MLNEIINICKKCLNYGMIINIKDNDNFVDHLHICSNVLQKKPLRLLC